MNLLTNIVRPSRRRPAGPPSLPQNPSHGLPSTCILRKDATSSGSRFGHPNGGESGGLDREYLLSLRSGRSGAQHLGCTAVIGRRHSDIGGEEAGEAALRGEAEIK